MSLGVLNNIAAIYAENNLNRTQASLQNTLEQLSSGSRINSGADDAAGLSIADGLRRDSAALTQSATMPARVSVSAGADGALSQVTNLLNRAVTLATEARNGTLSTSRMRRRTEFQSILAEINEHRFNDTVQRQSGLLAQCCYSLTPVTRHHRRS